jgi:carboxylesterase type B
MEIIFVFGNIIGQTALEPRDAEFSHVMMDYWIAFANNLNPNDHHGRRRKHLVPSAVCYVLILGLRVEMAKDDSRKSGATHFT